MIQFDHTNQTESGQIEFVNQNGDVVKTYPLSELEKYVTDNLLNMTYETVDASGTTDLDSPDYYEGHVIEVYEPVNKYIDNNWDEVTKAFYIAKNPYEFKSSNSPQETRRVG